MANRDERTINEAERARQAGDWPRAERLYLRFLADAPQHTEANYRLGLVLYAQDRLPEAMQRFLQVVELNPNYSDALHYLAILASRFGDVGTAIALMEQAITLDPDNWEFQSNLGAFYLAVRQLDAAAVHLYRAAARNPRSAETHNNLGLVLSGQGDFDAAITSFREACRLRPDWSEARGNLLRTLHASGRMDELVACYRQVDGLLTTAAAFGDYLLALQYSSASIDYIYDEHRRFSTLFESPLRAAWSRHANNREGGRRLRLGYLSPDFCHHAVAYFIEPILAHHDHVRFEVYCYYNHTQQDVVTTRLKSYVDHWFDCAELSDDELSAHIRADGIDILVDLSGHTARNRLLTFARKPAPVQVTWLGYAGTTGLDAMDYRLTDAELDPPALSDRYHSERLVRLSASAAMTELDADLPSVNVLPALTGATFTYACLNGHAKISDENLRVWSLILKRHSESQLMFGNAEQEGIRTNLIRRMAMFGIPAERLVFQPRMEMADYLALHQQIDLALDPYPYNGGTTTSISLWMGVPVISLAGTRTVSRCGVSLLTHVGLEVCIGDDEADYIERALSLAHDLECLNGIRQSLRERIRGLIACHPEQYTREVEAAYRGMWETWCISQ